MPEFIDIGEVTDESVVDEAYSAVFVAFNGLTPSEWRAPDGWLFPWLYGQSEFQVRYPTVEQFSETYGADSRHRILVAYEQPVIDEVHEVSTGGLSCIHVLDMALGRCGLLVPRSDMAPMALVRASLERIHERPYVRWNGVRRRKCVLLALGGFSLRHDYMPILAEFGFQQIARHNYLDEELWAPIASGAPDVSF